MSRAFITLIFMTYAASLPTLSREWAMTATQAGLVQTCFTAGFGISLFLTSWLADHVGARRMFVWSCWSGALAALAFALGARSYEQALWLYGLVGLSQGGSYTPAIMLVAQQLPPSRRGGGVGWVLAGMSAGYVGSISLAIGLIARFDYRVAFVACALGTLVGAVFGSVAAAKVENRVAGERARTVPHLSLLTERRSLLLTIGYVGHCWELFGMWTWVPAFLIASLGARIAEARIALGAVGLGVAIASGGCAFGRIKVDEGDVLYLALEDTGRRLQSRLAKVLQGSPAPARLVLATRNRKKCGEMVELLAPLGIDVLSVAEFPDVPEVVEDGETFAENAAKKASQTARHLHAWVLGEDSGLMVDALGGAPGVYSARFSGPGATAAATATRATPAASPHSIVRAGRVQLRPAGNASKSGGTSASAGAHNQARTQAARVAPGSDGCEPKMVRLA